MLMTFFMMMLDGVFVIGDHDHDLVLLISKNYDGEDISMKNMYVG